MMLSSHHIPSWLLPSTAALSNSTNLITLLQFHGLIPAFLLGTLWFISGWVRLQALKRFKKESLSNQKTDTAQKYAAPFVTVVLPTRGYRSNSIVNWEAILSLEYTGHLEFVFVLEAATDPANPIVERLAQSAGSFGTGNRDAKVVYAGNATQSSQKIHNLIAGITSASSLATYILCLDDDVHLHAGALMSLIADMERNPDIRVATGYPFDIPAENASILSYAALAYHLPLVIAFSVKERTHFVWGGCMMFRAVDVGKDDALGFIKAWSDGGYSDDLTIAARCTQLGLDVLCPSYAIFPQYLDTDYSVKQYWNYLRRQLVVLDTYSSDHNRRTNHIMAVLHCYFSWAFVLPLGTVFVKICCWVMLTLKTGVLLIKDHGDDRKAPMPPASSASDDLNYISTALFIGFVIYDVVALYWMTGIVCSLLEYLNPKTLKNAQLSWRFHWLKLWIGFVAANAVLPFCMIYTFMTRHIVWADVLYYRKGGKVVKVKHL